jgi:protein-tyrosine phosphatase
MGETVPQANVGTPLNLPSPMSFRPQKLVPATFRRWRFVLANLDWKGRRALIGSVLGRRTRDWRPVVRQSTQVLFVCQGNIIRSPLAEQALRAEAQARGRPIQVESAGLSARPGEGADPRAVESGEETGLSLAQHQARFLDAEQVEGAGAIFVMDRLNLGRILARFPESAERVFLLGGLQPDGSVSLTEIHDPVTGTLADVCVARDEVVNAVRLIASAWDQAG